MNNPNAENSECGSILIVTIIILVLLTVMGLVATNTTTTDLMIAANDRDYKQNFFTADAGLNKEFQLIPSYSITLTVPEQKNHGSYYLVKSDGDFFGDITSSDTDTENATVQYVGNHEYKYAILFSKREQALAKGEGARTVDRIYNEIITKIPGSVALRSKVFRRVTN
ncbi:MAG: PilX N-terminal domain-containing pilus assembly protein [Desulfoplanes sp.]|jgi:hypothetical protein|nr:PilX N-terminal domain-containing pilus assembly protein [Desulfoplanes sp.]MDD4649566.1 PilX N-terminal domain-containing pilus assembly protein [Desulfoplanes sp.]